MTGKKWRRRYFHMGQGFKLYYYKSSTMQFPQGYIDLEKVRLFIYLLCIWSVLSLKSPRLCKYMQMIPVNRNTFGDPVVFVLINLTGDYCDCDNPLGP